MGNILEQGVFGTNTIFRSVTGTEPGTSNVALVAAPGEGRRIVITGVEVGTTGAGTGDNSIVLADGSTDIARFGLSVSVRNSSASFPTGLWLSVNTALNWREETVANIPPTIAVSYAIVS